MTYKNIKKLLSSFQRLRNSLKNDYTKELIVISSLSLALTLFIYAITNHVIVIFPFYLFQKSQPYNALKEAIVRCQQS